MSHPSNPTSWDGAPCLTVYPELFFDPARTAEAKRVCDGCPLVVDCLLLALERERHAPRYGVFGALTAAEQARIDPSRYCEDCQTTINHRPTVSTRCEDCQATYRAGRTSRWARRRRRTA